MLSSEPRRAAGGLCTDLYEIRMAASYLRRGNTVLIHIRVGAGLRLGVNAGYMRFSHEQRWLPF